MLSTLILVISLCLLMYLAYKGFSIVVVSPIIALAAVLLSNDGYVLASLTQIYMPKVGGFIVSYFPIFLLSAIFGNLMEYSGSAQSIAEFITKKVGEKRAILATVLSCSMLTYGGISLFVVAFAVYPIAVELFAKSDTPKRLIPGAIALGSFSYTMTAMPGTTAIQNAIPAQYFGTDTFAAPGIGLIATIIIFVLGMFWLEHRAKDAKKMNEGFGESDGRGMIIETESTQKVIIAFAPIIIVILCNYFLVKQLFPSFDTSYLTQSKYGNVSLEKVASNWAIISSLFLAVVFMLLVHAKKLKKMHVLNKGAMDSLSPIFNTAAVVGYGAIMSHMRGFEIIKDFALKLFPDIPTVSSSLVTAMMCAITGSASGGMTIALESMADTYMKMAVQAGVSPELLHRIVCMASGAMDTMPHNGAVVTLLAVCGITYKKSYKDIFLVSAFFPLIGLAVSIILGQCFGSF